MWCLLLSSIGCLIFIFFIFTEVAMDANRAFCPRVGCDTVVSVRAASPAHCPTCRHDFCSQCNQEVSNHDLNTEIYIQKQYSNGAKTIDKILYRCYCQRLDFIQRQLIHISFKIKAIDIKTKPRISAWEAVGQITALKSRLFFNSIMTDNMKIAELFR